MYNLIEYSDNYSMTSQISWNYYRGEGNDAANENNVAGNYRIDKTKIIGSTAANKDTLDTEVVVPLNH